MSIRKILAQRIISLVLCAMPFVLLAQAKWNLLPDKPGKWIYSYHNEPYGPNAEINYKLTPVELAAIKQKMAEVAKVLHQNPEITNLMGYDVAATSSFYTFYCNNKTSPTDFPQAEISLKFYSLWGDNAGNVKRYWGEAPEVDCFINNMQPSDKQYQYIAPTDDVKDVEFNNSVKKLNELFIRPAIVKEIAPGITAYADGTIVIAEPDKPYWIPVTFGEWFDLQLAFQKHDSIIESKKPRFTEQEMHDLNIDPKLFENTPYSFLKKDKAAFPAELLLANSCTLEELIKKNPDMAIPKLSGIFQGIFFPHMRLNPDYFNKSLPKSAIQIIILRANTSVFQGGSDCSDDDAARTACCKFAGSVDFQALQKLLIP